MDIGYRMDAEETIPYSTDAMKDKIPSLSKQLGDANQRLKEEMKARVLAEHAVRQKDFELEQQRTEILRLKKEQNIEKIRLENDVSVKEEENRTLRTRLQSLEDLINKNEEIITKLCEENEDCTETLKLCRDILRGEEVDEDTLAQFIEAMGREHWVLHVAVSLGLHSVVNYYKKHNRNLLHERNRRDWTPLLLAAAKGDKQLVSLLLDKGHRDIETQDEPTALHIAAANGHIDAAKLLIDAGLSTSTTYHNCKPGEIASVMGHDALSQKMKGFLSFIKCEPKPQHCLNGSDFDGLRLHVSPSAAARQRKYLVAVRKLDNPYYKIIGPLRDNLRPSRDNLRPSRDNLRPGSSMSFEVVSEAGWRKRGSDSSDRQENVAKISKLEERRKKGTPNGLPNLGNTCYMNSILQCLYHLPPFSDPIREVRASVNPQTVLGAVVKVVRALDTNTAIKDTTSNLKRVAGHKVEQYRGYSQNEAHSFLSHMLEWLREEMVALPQAGLGGGGAEGGQSVVLIDKLFQGSHTITTTCHESDTPRKVCSLDQIFVSISLPVLPSNHGVPLKALLTKHHESQFLDWPCQYCGGKTHPCLNTQVINKFPLILVLHMSRVNDSSTSSNKTLVQYPEKLTVDGSNGKSQAYQLSAVCCHYGTMVSGHYTAYCKTAAGQWFYFNDQSVTTSSIHQVLNQNEAHILFYEADGSTEGLIDFFSV